jgi:hypothetical protein
MEGALQAEGDTPGSFSCRGGTGPSVDDTGGQRAEGLLWNSATGQLASVLGPRLGYQVRFTAAFGAVVVAAIEVLRAPVQARGPGDRPYPSSQAEKNSGEEP